MYVQHNDGKLLGNNNCSLRRRQRVSIVLVCAVLEVENRPNDLVIAQCDLLYLCDDWRT